MKLLHIVVRIALVLSFIVVMLGAFTRLTDAGLGCPDWPGCYGKLFVSEVVSDYPHTVIEPRKAWTEMIHRYAAGTLALLILFIALDVWLIRKRAKTLGQAQNLPTWRLPLALMLLVVFQALLGMWTVTFKLLPVVVMGHLLGGLLIFSCLCYLSWQFTKVPRVSLLSKFVTLGLCIVFCQVALGGWVSSNYAGIACIGFPTCNGQWLPTLKFAKGFNLFSSIGLNYQGGLLDNESRITIQMVHRFGAWITAIYVLVLASVLLIKTKASSAFTALKSVAWLAIFLILLQFALGVINVTYLLPLWAAVMHNSVAALLLATLVSMRYLTSTGEA